MRKLRSVIFAVGLMLFILSAAMIYLSIKNMSAMPSAGSYEDKGTYTFIPYQVLPVQVGNTWASGRSRRMNPTKTVYMVYYKDNSGSGYQWMEQAATREKGQEIVEPEQTAESYTAGLQKKYRTALGTSAGYILFYALAWCIVWKRGRRL